MISLFIDALSYSYIKDISFGNLKDVQIAPLLQNVGYSSSLHWELYCSVYPDKHGFFVDWVNECESNKAVCLISKLFAFTDSYGDLGVYCRKFLDRIVFRKNVFANIPFRFRPYFCNKSDYLFWNIKNYGSFDLFKPFCYAMQDEGHKSFQENLALLEHHVKNGEKDIFGVFGEIDTIGHNFPRGNLYNERVGYCIDEIFRVLEDYQNRFPKEPILVVSDHGMSTINELVDVELDSRFGKQSMNSYIAYSDTAIMCVFCHDEVMKNNIKEYLGTFDFGHVLTEEERKYYGITNHKYGDIIFNLKEGFGFKDSWFGKSIRKNHDYHVGMHGFWPEWTATDQLASIMLINGKKKLDERYDYKSAYKMINEVMKGE